MNYPHSDQALLHHPRESELPLPIRYFVRALELCPQLWKSEDGVRQYLDAEAHKSHHVDTVVYYVQASNDLHKIWQVHLIDASFANHTSSSLESRLLLSPQQNALLQRYQDLLARQRREVMVTEETPQFPLQPPAPTSEHQDWRRYQLLLGKPGTSKSQVLKRLICSALESTDNVALCAPLAILISAYREQFPDELYADTLRGMFHIPIHPEEPHLVNYRLGHYDLLVVEEASMISERNFALLNATLNKQVRRPLVVVARDERQQPPLET